MENIEFPISWTNEGGSSYTKDDDLDIVPALPEPLYVEKPAKADKIPEHWDEDTYIGPEADEEVPVPMNFEDQNFDAPSYITLARIYDLLAVIALKVDPIMAEKVLDEHEAGHLIADPPYLNFEDEETPESP